MDASPAITLEFQGYWRDKKKASVPAAPGIYCVYTCIYSGKKQACSPQKLVYIGAAEDVRASLKNPEGLEGWESHIDTGEELCYSYAEAAPEQCRAYAAALVRRNKPPENPAPEAAPLAEGTAFALSGAAAFLAKRFSTA